MRTKEEILAISDYPLMQTEFLYDSKKGRATLLMQGCYHGLKLLDSLKYPRKARDKFTDKKNKEFDYSMFHFMFGTNCVYHL